MSLLDSIPSPEAIEAALARIRGDGAAGTGVAGAATLLGGINTAKLSGSLTGALQGNLSVSMSLNPSGLADVAAQFSAVANAVPKDPAALIAPLTEQLASIRSVGLSALPDYLSTHLGSLRDLNDLIPTDSRDLLGAVSSGLDAVQAELKSGALRDLKGWAAGIEAVRAQLQPLLGDAPDVVADRLVAFLGDQVKALVAALNPVAGGFAGSIGLSLDAALSTDRLGELQGLIGALTARLEEARVAIEAGDLATTTHLDAALAAQEALVRALADIAAGLEAALKVPWATAEGLSTALSRHLDQFARIEVVDLGADVKARIAAAIGRVEAAIEATRIEAARDKVRELFAKLDGLIEGASLESLLPDLSALTAPLEAAAGLLDGAIFEVVAALRGVLTQAAAAVESASSALGTVDAEGNFQFHVQEQIETFLTGIQTTLQNTLQPLVTQFRETIAGTLQQVADSLAGVQAEITGVQAELVSGLQGVADQLATLDVPGTMEQVRQKLEVMLAGLGEINFDVVVDPVIGEIKKMADQLRTIDVSAMGEIQLGAFKVSVSVIVDLDFTGAVTAELTASLDDILDLPKQAVREVEASVETALARLRALDPTVILSPLDDLFKPIQAGLDGLKPDVLVQPLTEWHTKALAGLDSIRPGVLLQPVIKVHQELTGTMDRFSPAVLAAPLVAAVAEARAGLGSLDLAAPLAALGTVVEDARRRVRSLAPTALVDPLVQVFDQITAALAAFDPAALLEPVTGFFTELAAPLQALTQAHADTIAAGFQLLREILDQFDPRKLYAALRSRYAAVLAMLPALNVGSLIASLKAPFESLNAAFNVQVAAGGNGVALSGSLAALNPLRNNELSQLAVTHQGLRSRLEGAFPASGPPAALVASYQAIEPRLLALVPAWLRPNLTPAQVRAAFQTANPLNVGAEITRLWQAVLAKWATLDPRVLQQELQTAFDRVAGLLDALDPATLAATLQAAITRVTDRLTALDLTVVTAELDGLFNQVKARVLVLDPTAIIQRLDALAGTVKAELEALRPADALAGLEAPLAAARAIAAEFNPTALMAPLKEVFAGIDRVLAQIDVGVLLQPLIDVLDRMRDELEKALDRTASAFNDMLQAVPV